MDASDRGDDRRDGQAGEHVEQGLPPWGFTTWTRFPRQPSQNCIHARWTSPACWTSRLVSPTAKVAALAANVIGGAGDEQALPETVLHGQDGRNGRAQIAYLRDGQAKCGRKVRLLSPTAEEGASAGMSKINMVGKFVFCRPLLRRWPRLGT